jgi:hypothetical protein
MPNLRVVYNNVANQSASLVASTTSGSLVASNLLTDAKTQPWRSTGTTATLTATWSTSVSVAMVALPFSNLSPTATLRVQCYTLSSDSSSVLDTGNVLCAAGGFNFSAPVGFGGGVYAAIWFASTSVQKIVVTITDTSNPAGYIQAGKLVTGTYWTPDRNAETDSAKLTAQDDTKLYRSEAGSQSVDRGPMYKKLTFDLAAMSAVDRNNAWRVVAGGGMSNIVYVSLLPESTDAYEEQMYSICGRLTTSSALTYKYQHLAATQMQIEEI